MKRISPAGVTFVVGAILVGLAAAYAVRHLSRPEVTPPKATAKKTVTIVVAKYNLPQYTRITDEYLEERQVSPNQVPEGALTLKSRALYRLAKGTIVAGQPIRDQDLYNVGEVPLLSERLPPGYRAVTLGVDAKAAVNGMIQPESLVDINLTVKNERPEIGGMATLTLLRRVRVLATSRSRFPASEDRPGELRNITVAVTPEQANKLILAERYGTLSVVLCSKLEDDNAENAEAVAQAESNASILPTAGQRPSDTLPSAANGLSQEDSGLVNIYSLLGISPLTPQPMPEKPFTKTAQIWRGSKVEEVTFVDWQIKEAENATLVAEGKAPQPFTPGSLSGNLTSTSWSGKAKAETDTEEDCPECAAKRAREAAAQSRGEKPSPTPAPQLAPTTNQASNAWGGVRPMVVVPLQGAVTQ